MTRKEAAKILWAMPDRTRKDRLMLYQGNEYEYLCSPYKGVKELDVKDTISITAKNIKAAAIEYCQRCGVGKQLVVIKSDDNLKVVKVVERYEYDVTFEYGRID